MKAKNILTLAVAVWIVSFCCRPSASADDKWTRLLQESAVVLSEIQQMPDQGIPEDFLRSCYAIAIFPSTVSGGFIFGGTYGQGVILVRDPATGNWSAPAVFTVAGGSWGWQFGGQATDLVLLVMGRRSVEGILKGKVKLGVDAAIAAGPLGRSAQAATDAHLRGGILSYSRSRGLFIGIKLEGTVLAQHFEANRALYNQELTAEDILLKRKVRTPTSGYKLLKILEQFPLKK